MPAAYFVVRAIVADAGKRAAFDRCPPSLESDCAIQLRFMS